MRAHIGKTLFGLRFIIGLRFFSTFLAGSMKIPWRTFFFFDTLALIIHVPLLVYLGYHSHATLSAIIRQVTVYRHVVTFVLISLLGLVASLWVNRVFLRNGEPSKPEERP